MNLNLINKWCWEWSQEDWQEAYADFCNSPDVFGVGKLSKKEYYDLVTANHKRLKDMYRPLSEELKKKWIAGKRAAKEWARQRGCDMNGRLLIDIAREQRNNDALKTAQWAEDVAINTKQRLDYLIERVRK